MADTVICSGDSILIQGYNATTYNWDNGLSFNSSFNVAPDSTRNYILNALDSAGCKAVDTVKIKVNPSYLHTEVYNICDGDSVFFEGDKYFEDTIVMVNYSTVTGCDSIIRLNLEVSPKYHNNLSYSICDNDSFYWEGNYYNVTGSFYADYSTVHGCDSLLELALTVNPTYIQTSVFSICENDSLYWEGNYYNTDSTYIVNYISLHGCDSMMKLILQVNPVFRQLTTYSVCDYDSVFFEGRYYSVDTTVVVNYSSINGCDSIMQLNLEVTPSYYDFVSYSICDNDSLFWEGLFYNSEGLYSANYSTINGCDSLLEMKLSVIQNPTNLNICGQNTVVLNQTEMYYVMNSSLLYTWLVDKGTIIQQIANNVIQVQWDSVGLGRVSVIAENEFGCHSDTLVFNVLIGITGFDNNMEYNELLIYPNPTTSEIKIEAENFIEAEIYNNIGQIIIKSDKKSINLQEFSAGVYFVKIFTDKSVISVAIVKK